ncbi:acetyl-CoA synthetase-like protein [Xylaria palmicola]|nr:acetyl-CoA synthetase-like protein [Xylaria palmicola]
MGEENLNQIAYVDGGDLSNPRQSIYAHIEDGLLKNPDRPAVIFMHQTVRDFRELLGVAEDSPDCDQDPKPSSDFLTITYAQLHQSALDLVSGLIANGLAPGSTVLCAIPNIAEHALLVWACALLRLTITAADPGVLEDTSKLTRFLELVKPQAAVVYDIDVARAIDSASANLQATPLTLRLIVNKSADDIGSGWKTFRTVLQDGSSSRMNSQDESRLIEEARRDDPDRIYAVLFTSGTTSGQPKGCPMRVGSVTHILESQSWLINADNCGRVLQQASNAHSIALRHMLQTWRAGGAVVVPTGRSFAVEDTIDAIRHHGATFIVLSPTMMHALEPVLADAADTNAVNTIHLGGDAVTKEALVKCATMFPRARVFINHGMSEGGGFYTWPFIDRDVSEIPYLGGICPVGAVARGARLRVWDSDRSSTAPYRHPGELHVSTDSLIRGYLGGVDGSSFYRDDERALWMNTGDVGMMTEDGLVYILGRSKDAIKRAGIAIMPAALESSIAHFTGAQACVVAVPNPKQGHDPFVVLSSLQDFTQDQISDHVLQTFGGGYALGGLVSLDQIGLTAFPVNGSHKIMKSEVQRAVIEFVESGTRL